jgi:hypothetical protein
LSDYENTDSMEDINKVIKKAPLKNALQSNRMIDRIHENFDHNTVTVWMVSYKVVGQHPTYV